MNKNKLCELLRSLREKDIICYAYRETAMHILMGDQTEGVINLVTDVSANVITEALGRHGFTDVSVNNEYVDAKNGTDAVKILSYGDEQENLSQVISQPLTICSLLFRDDGSVYDEFGGTDDIKKKSLRKTGIPIKDKIQFCNLCFELTLKKGFVPDTAVKDEMKKIVTLPLSKKIQFILSVRNYLKNQNFNVEYLLNVLSYNGLFSNAGTLSIEKKNEIRALIRKAGQASILLLLCYLAAFKGEHLKSIPNVEIKKESYEKICAFIKTNDTVDLSSVRKSFPDAEVAVILFVMEFLALIAGKEFVVTEERSRLFRTVDKSAFWKKNETPTQKESATSVKENKPEPPSKKREQTVETEPEDMFGGIEEEGYEVEDDGSWAGDIGEAAALNLRNQSQNHYLKK